MSIEELKKQVSEKKQDLAMQTGKRDQLKEEEDLLILSIQQKNNATKLLEESRLLLQRAGVEAREAARLRLEETATDALKYIFGNDFEFHIELKETKGRTEAEFYVSSDYKGERIKTKPEDARGGGIIDIISLALRVALVQIYSNPKVSGPIILDEPGKHVSAEYTSKLADFLQQIHKNFGRQIILSTHQPDLASVADSVYHVDIRGGVSRVERIETRDD